jgi:hypothetical protein
LKEIVLVDIEVSDRPTISTKEKLA